MTVNKKYSIAAVQQDKLLSLELDLKDAFILTYLKDINSARGIVRRRFHGKTFIWINYSKLMEYLPVLKIKTVDALYRRFKKYENLGIVDKYLHKSMNGSYTFFHLNTTFFDLFEISKTFSTDEELKEQIKEMGFTSDEKSGGFGRKVGSISDEKSALNTPNNNTPKKNSSSREELAAASDNFIKEVKELLLEYSMSKVNSNTLKNIMMFSGRDIKEIRAALYFMKVKEKENTPSILVAILRDGDYKDKANFNPTELKRSDKIAFMSKKLGADEVARIRGILLKEIGSECDSLDNQLGNTLCMKFNNYITQGGSLFQKNL